MRFRFSSSCKCTGFNLDARDMGREMGERAPTVASESMRGCSSEASGGVSRSLAAQPAEAF